MNQCLILLVVILYVALLSLHQFLRDVWTSWGRLHSRMQLWISIRLKDGMLEQDCEDYKIDEDPSMPSWEKEDV